MDKREKIYLTNEHVSKRFSSSFQLVTYAIKLAKNMIQTGRSCRTHTIIQNKAFQILLEIGDGTDKFDTVWVEEEERQEVLPTLEEMLKKTAERKTIV